MARTFTETEKTTIRENTYNAYRIGNDNSLFTVCYAIIDSFDVFDDGVAYFSHRFDMENFVSNLENRFKKYEQTYYISFDGDFVHNI